MLLYLHRETFETSANILVSVKTNGFTKNALLHDCWIKGFFEPNVLAVACQNTIVVFVVIMILILDPWAKHIGGVQGYDAVHWIASALRICIACVLQWIVNKVDFNIGSTME